MYKDFNQQLHAIATVPSQRLTIFKLRGVTVHSSIARVSFRVALAWVAGLSTRVCLMHSVIFHVSWVKMGQQPGELSSSIRTSDCWRCARISCTQRQEQKRQRPVIAVALFMCLQKRASSCAYESKYQNKQIKSNGSQSPGEPNLLHPLQKCQCHRSMPSACCDATVIAHLGWE